MRSEAFRPFPDGDLELQLIMLLWLMISRFVYFCRFE